MQEFSVATNQYQSKKQYVPTVLQSENGIQMVQFLVMLMTNQDKQVNSAIMISIQLSLLLLLLTKKLQVPWPSELWLYKIKLEEDFVKYSHLKHIKSITSSTELQHQSVLMEPLSVLHRNKSNTLLVCLLPITFPGELSELVNNSVTQKVLQLLLPLKLLLCVLKEL